MPALLLLRNDDLLTGKSLDKILKKFFSSPASSFFALLIAVVSINAWQLVLPNFSYDNSFSIAAAKNIYDGKGYTLRSASADDLAQVRYESLNRWPPGYSLLLVLVKKISRVDWVVASYILNAITATLLMLASRKILILLQIKPWIINCYLLYAGFVPYPFLSCWFTDLAAVAFFMCGLTFILRIITGSKAAIMHSIIAAIFFSFCFFLKYLYLPVSLVPFGFLLFYGKKRMDKRLMVAGLTGIFFIGAAIAWLIFFQQQNSGSAFYINPVKRGIFPQHLLRIAPLVPGSLINLQFYYVQLSNWFHIPFYKMAMIFKWLNYFLIAGMLVLLWRYYKIYGLKINNAKSFYISLGITISAVVIILLAYLSFTSDSYFSKYVPDWTYLEELRYYSVSLIFIQQSILLLVIYKRNFFSALASNFFIAVIISIASIEVAHGVYYLSKQVLVKKQVGIKRESEQADLLALKTCEVLMNQGKYVVICSDNHDLANIASLSGAPVIYEWDSLNEILHASKPTTLFIAIHEKTLPTLNSFFTEHKPGLLFKQPKFYFYVTDIH